MLFLNIGMIIILVYDWSKGLFYLKKSLGVDYWATLIMLFAILPGNHPYAE